MHQVEIIKPLPFQGWDSWKEELEQVAPDVAAMSLSMAVRTIVHTTGNFGPAGSLNAINLPVLQQYFLGRWKEIGFQRPGTFDLIKDPAFTLTIDKAARRVAGARQGHGALSSPLELPLSFKIAKHIWFSTLEQQFAGRVQQFEIARTNLLYDQLWQEEHGSVCPLPAAISPAMMLLFGTIAHMHGPLVDDVPRLFAEVEIPMETIEHLLELHTADIDQVLTEHSFQGYPAKWYRSPYWLNPLLRLNNGSLFCPEPHWPLQALEARCHQHALDYFMSNHGARAGYEIFAERFGHVFERYVHGLLASIAAEGTVHREFRYAAGETERDSPDLFVLDGTPIVIECKVNRYPHRADAHEISVLCDWLAHLAGKRDGTREPFEQGAGFWTDWRNGLDGPEWLPKFSDTARYVIVSYSNLPWTANWPRFRREYVEPAVPPGLRDFARRVLFISMNDLERISVVAEGLRRSGSALDFGGLIREYESALASSPLTRAGEGERAMQGGIGDFALERFAGVDHAPPAVLENAIADFFDKVSALGFGTRLPISNAG